MSPFRFLRSRSSATALPIWLTAPLLAFSVGVSDGTLRPALASSDTAVAVEPHDQAPASLNPAELETLAAQGQFLALRQALSLLPAAEPTASHRAAFQTLQTALDRQTDNAGRRLEERRAAFDAASTRLNEALETGRTETALIQAIEAHGLAEDSTAFLATDAVTRLVPQAIALAQAAESRRDWVEALSIYRLLELLYENQARFKNDVQRLARRVQILQVYTPQRLTEQYRQRAERRALEMPEDERQAPPALDLEFEPWTERLDGVEQRMLLESLSWAVRSHVDHGGYAPLIRGAIDALRVLVTMEELDQVFPSLRDQAARDGFVTTLDNLFERVQSVDATLNVLEAESILHQVLEANARSVDLPKTVLLYEMTNGATATLDDFSAVVWPQELRQFNRGVSGSFFGIGIMISRRDGRLIVVSPQANTPAQQAGVKAGDIITQVNGRDTATWTLDKAVREITGPEGTVVSIGIERSGQPAFEVDIVRRRIAIESIRGWQVTAGGNWDYWIDRDAGLGYVRLSQFIPQSATDLDAAIANLQQQGDLRGLILDLRFNPGGLLDSAVQISDRFIPAGPIVSTVTVKEDGSYHPTKIEYARQQRTYPDFPVVVLINQGSASASEIVAGALQDYGRALIVGTRSFGKGSVQDIYPLAKQGLLGSPAALFKLTRQYYMLPHGRIIHRKEGATTWGIEPDLVVEMTNQQVADAIELRQEADVLQDAPVQEAAPDTPAPSRPVADLVEKGLDAQLEAAVLILKTRQLAHELATPGPRQAAGSTR